MGSHVTHITHQRVRGGGQQAQEGLSPRVTGQGGKAETEETELLLGSPEQVKRVCTGGRQESDMMPSVSEGDKSHLWEDSQGRRERMQRLGSEDHLCGCGQHALR
jgi:hypothetical protein